MDKKDFIISEEQLLAVLNMIAEAPAKHVNQAINILSNLKRIEIKKEETE